MNRAIPEFFSSEVSMNTACFTQSKFDVFVVLLGPQLVSKTICRQNLCQQKALAPWFRQQTVQFLLGSLLGLNSKNRSSSTFRAALLVDIQALESYV